ncbi:uncharacterized protein LOC125863860 [Solanum stenotomum]|uniref:uncharacterized protein LOC125863860 n=1 Tax=Solanum stenotomum TaxID=172797 RepID=UPI0020D073D1|nr:uncharacterized protein LOC125863860 [Solanum stenotomum]
MSEKNIKNRKNQMNPHASGKKSFALVRNKLEKDKETVSSKDLCVFTRTRKSERLYKTSNENTTGKIAEMEEIEKQMSINDEYVDAFSSVMGPEHPGCKMEKQMEEQKKTGRQEVIADVIAQLKHAGLIDPNILKMEKQMEEQKKTVRQEVIADVIAQLKHAGLIDPNILATLSIPSPRESTSIQGAEQGDEIEKGDERCSEDLT